MSAWPFSVNISQAATDCPGPLSRSFAGVRVTANGPLDVNGHIFTPSGFLFEKDGFRLAVDPVCPAYSGPVDCILITHGHPDHFSLPSIRALVRAGQGTDVSMYGPPMYGTPIYGPPIYGPPSLRRKCREFDFRPLTAGDAVREGPLSITALAAYNEKPVFAGIRAHPEKAGGLAFAVDFAGTLIFHAGDSDAASGFLAAFPPGSNQIDIACVPVGGDNLTFNPESAAAFVKALSPRLAIPMHFEHDLQLLERFSSSLGDSSLLCAF